MNGISVSTPALHRMLERWSIYLTICVMAIALAVLAGWQWDIEFLRRPRQGIPSMNPTTAGTLFLCSLSFLFLRNRGRRWKAAGILMNFIVIGVGVACILGYFYPALAGGDGLLFPDQLRLDFLRHRLSNRMGVNSACCLLLTVFCLLRMRTPASPQESLTMNRPWLMEDLAALSIGGLGLLSMLGFLYRVQEYPGWFRYFPMSPQASLCFLLLAMAFFLCRPDRGVMGVLTGPLSGSVAARRVLPFALLFPMVLGTIRLYAYRKGYLSTELGVTLLIFSIIICFAYIVWDNSRMLNKRDAQRQQAEEELAANESGWEATVNSVKDYAIFLVDPEGRILSWNEGAATIKGYRPEEIIGRSISIFYTDEEIRRGEPRYNLEQAAANGRHYSEGWRIRKNGERFWAEIVFTAIYDADRRVRAYAKITRDMTEQKAAQEKIAYFARLIEDTSDAIFSTGADGTIRTWNRASELLFGYTAEEVIGREATELMRPQLTDDVREPIRQQLQEEGFWKGEIIYLDRSGQRRTILQSVSPAHMADGQPGGYVIVGRDVTRWKEVEDQLRQFNVELERQVLEKTEAITQSNADLRALASRLTEVREEERAAMAREVHDELGQQLTGLKMDISLIARKAATESPEWLAAKAHATMSLLDTTIRTVRKIAAELRPSILDDLGLVAAIDWLGQEFMKRSGIVTAFHSSAEGIDVPAAVSIGLFRICQESLTNVARHSGAKNVWISFLRDGEGAKLTIWDDGRGFDPSGPRRNGKTLGLLGMRERATMMGGTLKIESGTGEGVCLSVAVPLITNETAK